jgi:alpha-galactosidase
MALNDLVFEAGSTGRVILRGGSVAPPGVRLDCRRDGNRYTFVVENRTQTEQRIQEVLLFDGCHRMPTDCHIHGDGYNMFSQTVGTLGRPEDVEPLTDCGHYRLPEPQGFRTVYGMLSMEAPDGHFVVLGFSSCRRFVGKFNISADRLQVVLSTEGLPLRAGEAWELEELVVLSGKNRDNLLRLLTERICECHPRLPRPERPTGWCSWYCYGPEITPELIRDNLTALRVHAPEIRYVQIDDGYQSWMGDWLATSPRFPEGVQALLREIRALGFEPAIWVAPFIASPESELFGAHPDWFVQDENGGALRSDMVTFGGWRQRPWYMLDGTHPQAQKHLEMLFRTMHEEWGCTYFKLDANMWGAMPFGRRHDPDATAVEAYRRGMAAVRRGAGRAFLLGCNHPIWPSFGEIHGSRNSMDIDRKWAMVKRVARENLLRNWQNDRLWWNDPDCLLLDTPDLSADEKSFHRAATYASGGMLLSGDAVTKYTEADWQYIRAMAGDPGTAAEFEDDQLTQGWIRHEDTAMIVLLNWTDYPQSRVIPLPRRVRIVDQWDGSDLGKHEGVYSIPDMPPRSGRVLRLVTENA